jgi:hypothetical protein
MSRVGHAARPVTAAHSVVKLTRVRRKRAQRNLLANLALRVRPAQRWLATFP